MGEPLPRRRSRAAALCRAASVAVTAAAVAAAAPMAAVATDVTYVGPTGLWMSRRILTFAILYGRQLSGYR